MSYKLVGDIGIVILASMIVVLPVLTGFLFVRVFIFVARVIVAMAPLIGTKGSPVDRNCVSQSVL